MKPLWKIRILASALILFFGLATVALILAILLGVLPAASVPHLLFAVVINLGFVAGGIGLLKLKRWSWWLTLALCALSVIQFMWQLFATLTTETATKANEMISYIVVGIYLGIAFVLASDSVRKVFWEQNKTAP